MPTYSARVDKKRLLPTDQVSRTMACNELIFAISLLVCIVIKAGDGDGRKSAGGSVACMKEGGRGKVAEEKVVDGNVAEGAFAERKVAEGRWRRRGWLRRRWRRKWWRWLRLYGG